MVEKLIAQGRQLLRLLPCLPKQHTLTGKNNKSAKKDLPKRSTKRIRLININSSITVYYINSDVKLLVNYLFQPLEEKYMECLEVTFS